MGLFDDYNVDIDEVKVNSFDVNDGVYGFEIAEAQTIEGTRNAPDRVSFRIDYQLTDENGDAAGQKSDWFTLSEDGDSNSRLAKFGFSNLKKRLLELGLKGSELADFTGEEVLGLTGTLQLKTKRAKNGNDYQNIANVRVDEAEEEEAPAKKAPAKRAPAKKAPAKAAPAEESGEDDDNPFG